MQNVSTATIAPAADIREIIREMKLTTTESRAITLAREKIKTAADLGAEYSSPATCDRQNRPCPLLLASWDAGAAFVAEPSTQTAEALVSAVVKLGAAPAIESAIAGAIEQISKAADQSLVGTINSIFDRAEVQLKDQLETAQNVLDSAPGLQAEARLFRSKAAAAIQQAKDLRADAVTQPLRFLGWEIGI